MKRILEICFLIIAIVIIVFIVVLNKQENKDKIDENINENINGNILYSWDMQALNDSELLEIINKHSIDTLYQDFSTEYLKRKNNNFLKLMNNNKIQVYHLCGEKEWGLDKEATGMKKEIDKVDTYNKNNKYNIKGIVFDIEPYQDEKNVSKNFNFSLYVSALKEAYKYAQTKNLLMVVAIPIWFDSIDKNLLEELIKDASDEVSLMNYNIKYVKENMSNEIYYAQKYNKNINTIYEINFNDSNYFRSYEAINDNFENLKKEYSYSKLRKAYHHYDKMKKK